MRNDWTERASGPAWLGIAGALALTAAASSFAQTHDPNCIPHYDSSGAQTAHTAEVLEQKAGLDCNGARRSRALCFSRCGPE